MKWKLNSEPYQLRCLRETLDILDIVSV